MSRARKVRVEATLDTMTTFDGTPGWSDRSSAAEVRFLGRSADGGRGPGVHVRRYFAHALTPFDVVTNFLGIALHQFMSYLPGPGGITPLQFTKDYPWYSGVVQNKVDMAHENRLHGRERRFDVLCGTINPRKKEFGNPAHDRLPEIVFGGEMPKQRRMRKLHMVGNSRGSYTGGILGAREKNDGFNGGGPSLLSG